MKGFGGAGVLEVVEDEAGSTYRAVYTVKFAGLVYVLHAFQKKAKSGIKTPPQEVDKVRNRLKEAKAELVQRIRAIIADRKLTQSGAAAILGLDQPKVSSLVRGRVEGYSLDRLFRFLAALGRSLISIATGRRVFLEENFSGSSKAEARAGAVVE